MGLDAVVYCDCLERGCVRTSPNPEWQVGIASDGARYSAVADLELQIEFDAWNATACEHKDGVLIHHRIGNVALVASLREALAPSSEQLRITTGRIVAGGTHSGDSIEILEVRELAREVPLLAKIRSGDDGTEQCLRHFERQLQDLVDSALGVGKPIAF